jgi:cysteine desulfurase
VAAALGANPSEIFFTSGGTEADNLAVFGVCSAREKPGMNIVTTAVEHAAVTKAVRIWRRHGYTVTYVPIKGGELDLDCLDNAVNEQTALVSVMLVNNEMGTIFPVRRVREIIDRKGSQALLHTDAVQAFGKIPFSPESLGADLISLSAHKIHGIKGSGALYVKKGTKLFALQFGGGQEQGLRPGTESTPLIAAFGTAARLASLSQTTTAAHLTTLRDYCLERLRTLPQVVINSGNGAPHIVNFSLPGSDSRDTVSYLSEHGLYVSDGAACKSNYGPHGPHVLQSYGLVEELMHSAIRVSFCADNTREEVDALLAVLTDR